MTLKKNVVVLFGVLIGAFALWYILKEITIKKVLETFNHASLELIFLFIVVQFLLFLSVTYRWKLILESQGHVSTSIWRLLAYKVVGYGVSFLTPSAKVGGEPIRAGLVCKKEGIEFHKALSSVVIDKTLEISTNGLFTVIGFVVLLMTFVVSIGIQSMIISISAVLLFLIVAFNYRMFKGKLFFVKIFEIFRFHKSKRFENFMKKVYEFEELVVVFYRTNDRYFWLSIWWSVFSWFLMFLEYKLAGLMIGLDLTLFQLFMIICVVGAAFVVPIPMGLGALEAGQLGLFNLLRIGSAHGVALAFVVRIKDIFISAVGLILLAVFGLNFKEVIKDSGFITKEVKRLKKSKQ